MNQWATDNAALISFINAFSMVALTAIYVFFTIKIQQANKAAVEQSATIHREQTKPDVIVYFDMTIMNFLDLKLKNIGSSPAKNIKVLLKPLNEIANVEYLDKSSILNGIAFLAPDQTLKVLVGSAFEIKNTDEEYPKYLATITYTNMMDRGYSQEYVIDANMYAGNAQVVEKTIHDLTKEIEKMRKIMDKR